MGQDEQAVPRPCGSNYQKDMKLYATVTSERASKGQGGKYLDIVIKDAYKDVIGNIKVRVRNHEVGDLYCVDMDFANHVYIKQKGKKQKGEMGPYGMDTKNKFIPIDVLLKKK
jgi:hypothetical protein